MKVHSLVIFCIVLFNLKTSIGQNSFGIVFPKTSQELECQKCSKLFLEKPKEVKFSVEREQGNLYFNINDKNWFNVLFQNLTDGIAITVVDKERYACNKEIIDDNKIPGTILKPIYAQNLKKTLKEADQKTFKVLVGRLPENLLNKELEYNILFLNDKTLCRYQTIYHLEAYPWDLLDMGMYLDSLTYNSKKITTLNEGFVLKTKTLAFKIPFEKNKTEYYSEDIKPLYDSLRLTNFNIKKINIRAYASIEGSSERNAELQSKRGSSIAKAIQSFQGLEAVINITTSENWVEFLNDISETPYKFLKSLSKDEIKQQLATGLSDKLEPYLKNHRKAVIELELERKDLYKETSAETLVSLFNDAIKKNQLEEALEIQNSIFDKINEHNISPELLRKMEIPKQERFIKIFNKNSAFRFMNNIRLGMIVNEELKELEKMAPKDPKIKYNIVATTFVIWRYNWLEIDATKFEKQIRDLKNYGIHASLIDRMLVNFNIVMAEKYMQNRDYKSKDKSVDFIKAHYKNFPLSDFDYLSLAQFLSYYSKSDDAVDLLEAKARSIEINEDLLFYYLNLTLIDEELTEDENYRTIMLNAIALNKERFCKLFNSVERGGVTFQLLENEYLKNTYCENCNN